MYIKERVVFLLTASKRSKEKLFMFALFAIDTNLPLMLPCVNSKCGKKIFLVSKRNYKRKGVKEE